MKAGWHQRLLFVPAGAILAGLFAVPLAALFVVSFWSVRSFALRPDFTLAAYIKVWTDYAGVFGFTLGLALVTAAICAVLGFVFAYGARFHAGRWADALVLAVIVTLFGGYLVKVYAWKSILGADGILNSALMMLGVIDQPLPWLIYTPGAVVLTLVHFQLPFSFLPIYASLRNLQTETVEAARDLGASPLQIIRRVVIPQCRTGLVTAFAFAFLISAGDYVTPQFLGGPSTTMLGQFIAIEFSTRFNWPGGAAMSFALLAACLGIVGAVWMLSSGRRRA
ncbi:MAG TPA: ABC transporter permease [Verrucomicrobiae bacterium]|nr:ABC transporter permease [Verrucomicrobiae bacterium]